MKKTLVILTFALLLPLTSQAGYLDLTENYLLSASKTVRGNLYVGASSATFSGTVQGDLVAVGGDIALFGPVQADVLVAGGSVRAGSVIGGDARIGGGTVVVSETIQGDLILLAGDATVSSSASVGDDAVIIGGTVKLLGEIKGSAYIAGADVYIDGTILEKVKIVNARTVTVGPHAVIEGELYYVSPEEAVIEEGASIGSPVKHEYTNPYISAPDAKGFIMGIFGIAFVVRLAVLLITALVFFLVFRKITAEISRRATSHFWKSFLWGLTLIIGLPLGGLLLLTTVLGSILGVFTFMVWFALILLAQVYGGVVVASWFTTHILKREQQNVVPVINGLLGVLVLNVLMLVPYVGIFICGLFMLAAYGAISTIFYKHFFVGR